MEIDEYGLILPKGQELPKLCLSMGFYAYTYKSAGYKTEHTFYYYLSNNHKIQGPEVNQVQWN